MANPESVKFLIVDDLDENLHALEALLRRDGLAIFRAKSGPEALELLLRHDFSLALLDVQMPDMDGFELAELMRSTERTRYVPIIFITAAATDEGRRFRGYEAGAVDYVSKPVDPLIVRSKAQVFFDIGFQRQELARQKSELHSTALQLSNALHLLQAHSDNSPLAIVEFDSQLRLASWSKGAERIFGWAAREMVGLGLNEVEWLSVQQLREVVPALSDAFKRSVDRQRLDDVQAHHKDGRIVNCEWYCSVLRDPRGKLVSLNVQILDVTERRKAEETQRLLVGELNHRVKNTLASVQAIATQTLRHTRDQESFATTFSGRIQSLASAHSMLSDTTWKSASLADLIHDQLKLGTIDAERLAIVGPEVQLPPHAALRLALIFHELATNASKYGAFSNATGTIGLTWSVENGTLALRWQETGGPIVRTPARRGFGTTLIERSLKANGGSASATYDKSGIVWDISMALPRIEASEIDLRINNRSKVSVPGPQTSDQAQGDVSGLKILLIEDEPLVALDLASALENAGAHILGPVGTIEDALSMIEAESMDAAFLDGNLHGHSVDNVATSLLSHNIPFAFVSGYGREHLPSGFDNVLVIGKPFSAHQLVEATIDLTTKRPNVIRLRH